MISLSAKWFARKIEKTTDSSSICHGAHIVLKHQRQSVCLYFFTIKNLAGSIPNQIKSNCTVRLGFEMSSPPARMISFGKDELMDKCPSAKPGQGCRAGHTNWRVLASSTKF